MKIIRSNLRFFNGLNQYNYILKNFNKFYLYIIPYSYMTLT